MVFNRREEITAGECHGCHVTNSNLTWTEWGVSRHQGHGLILSVLSGGSMFGRYREIHRLKGQTDISRMFLPHWPAYTIKLTKTEHYLVHTALSDRSLSLPRFRLQVSLKIKMVSLQCFFLDIESHCIWRPCFAPGFESSTSKRYQCIFSEQKSWVMKIKTGWCAQSWNWVINNWYCLFDIF